MDNLSSSTNFALTKLANISAFFPVKPRIHRLKRANMSFAIPVRLRRRYPCAAYRRRPIEPNSGCLRRVYLNRAEQALFVFADGQARGA